MKKVLFAFAIAVAFAACNDSASTTEAPKDSTPAVAPVDTTKVAPVDTTKVAPVDTTKVADTAAKK